MVTFDPAKNRSNVAKHGMSLSDAERFDWDNCITIEDEGSYGEPRDVAIGYIGPRLCVYVYTLRDGEERAISLRKASTQEARYYDRERYGR